MLNNAPDSFSMSPTALPTQEYSPAQDAINNVVAVADAVVFKISTI